MQELEKAIVSQALEICELREKLAEAKSNEGLWYRLYTMEKEKPVDAANTDERTTG